MSIVRWLPVPVGEGWDDEQEPIVWIDLANFDRVWRLCDDYIPPGGDGYRYDRVAVWLPQRVAGDYAVYMPNIHRDEAASVSFHDGRHRLAWLRDTGGKALPVQVNAAAAEWLEASCGTRDRQTLLPVRHFRYG